MHLRRERYQSRSFTRCAVDATRRSRRGRRGSSPTSTFPPLVDDKEKRTLSSMCDPTALLDLVPGEGLLKRPSMDYNEYTYCYGGGRGGWHFFPRCSTTVHGHREPARGPPRNKRDFLSFASLDRRDSMHSLHGPQNRLGQNIVGEISLLKSLRGRRCVGKNLRHRLTANSHRAIP